MRQGIWVYHSGLADRLGRYLHLTENERRALAAMDGGERAIPRGAVLTGELAAAREFYLVRRGWLHSSVVLADGSRQILGLHLPGELAGDAGLPWARVPFALTAVTEAIVHVLEKSGLRMVFERQPRLAMLIHALSQVERAVLSDRLAMIGRMPALTRMAAMIVDVDHRLRAFGEDTADGFALPLTQEQIGDLLGLTAVHVNRMMRRLVDDGLIARTGWHIRVLDGERLARLANHVDRYGEIDTSWLPRGND